MRNNSVKKQFPPYSLESPLKGKNLGSKYSNDSLSAEVVSINKIAAQFFTCINSPQVPFLVDMAKLNPSGL